MALSNPGKKCGRLSFLIMSKSKEEQMQRPKSKEEQMQTRVLMIHNGDRQLTTVNRLHSLPTIHPINRNHLPTLHNITQHIILRMTRIGHINNLTRNRPQHRVLHKLYYGHIGTTFLCIQRYATHFFNTISVNSKIITASYLILLRLLYSS